MSGYLDTWKNVITNPRSFFEKIPKSDGYSEPLKFAIINYIIGGFWLFVLIAVLKSTFEGSVYIILLPIIGAVGLFINGIIYLILFKIVGGKGSYEGTFRLVAYSSAPVALTIIPILPLYSIYLLFVGGTSVHSVSKMRAGIVFLPVIAVGAIVLLAMIPFFFSTTPPEMAPFVSLRVLSATSTSIELRHQAGDGLKLSDVQFSVMKDNGEKLNTLAASKSGSETVYTGDTIRLYGADFGKSGDNVRIIAKYKNENVIFDTLTSIK